jgi:hypothetical protein
LTAFFLPLDIAVAVLAGKARCSDLAEKMILLISQSHDELLNMGRRAREKIEKEFDEKIVLNAYSSITGKQFPAVGARELFDRNSVIHSKSG